MWVLVVVFFMGDNINIRSVDYVYRSLESCSKAASSTYYSYMATRPDPSYDVLAYCSQIPKGV